MKFLLLLFLLFSGLQIQAQTVKGNVRDSQTGRILYRVKVESSKAVEFTDHQGNFSIAVNQHDSLRIHLNNYEVLKINLFMETKEKTLISILLKPKYIEIEAISVEGKTSKKDSNQVNLNLNIPKTPTFRKYVLGRADMSGNPRGFLANGSTATLFTVDLLAVKRMLFKRPEKIPLEKQLEADEYTMQYIDMTFSVELIKEMTGLEGDEALIFQNIYRPSMQEFSKMSEYDLKEYIKRSFEENQKSKK
ncbi:hypothetical protein CHU00_00980 [Sphingobacterium cellulitidis]|uniref:hypothetical protein n=1 Tax=Sphingobacterium cellulitidis TaxID=1768011 RepID=UPI000B94334A|nr:hypothetical protein [Sphingobacterium cellulitidis]OYD47480.1 hypothetical protein CHU00_00980 [Sphingobacterium cellulitidis]